MCIHYRDEERVQVQEQPPVFAQEKIQPITLTLTPDEATLLGTYMIPGNPILAFGQKLILKRAPEISDALFLKLTAMTDTLIAIQDQYPGYPMRALPDGVLA